MNEHELDRILAEIGEEQIAPPPDLIERTCRRMRRSRLLPLLVGLGIALQLLTIGALQLYLLSAALSAAHWAIGQAVLVAIAGMAVLLLLGARKRVRSVLYRLETAAGSR